MRLANITLTCDLLDHLTYALAYFKEAERDGPDDTDDYAGAAAAYALLADAGTSLALRIVHRSLYASDLERHDPRLLALL